MGTGCLCAVRIAAVAVFVGPASVARAGPRQPVTDKPPSKVYRGLLGPDSKKIKRVGGRTLLWAGGGSPADPDAQWYDFTDAAIPASELQFGIGKDRIRAIDDPLFVAPDDPRLVRFSHSGHRPDERPKDADGIMVAGFAYGGQARAFPVPLLDYHELVNTVVGGKPVTVGW